MTGPDTGGLPSRRVVRHVMLKNTDGRLKKPATVMVVVLAMAVLAGRVDRATWAPCLTLGTACLCMIRAILLSNGRLVRVTTLLRMTRAGPKVPTTAIVLHLMHWVILSTRSAVALLFVPVPVNSVV